MPNFEMTCLHFTLLHKSNTLAYFQRASFILIWHYIIYLLFIYYYSITELMKE